MRVATCIYTLNGDGPWDEVLLGLSSKFLPFQAPDLIHQYKLFEIWYNTSIKACYLVYWHVGIGIEIWIHQPLSLVWNLISKPKVWRLSVYVCFIWNLGEKLCQLLWRHLDIEVRIEMYTVTLMGAPWNLRPKVINYHCHTCLSFVYENLDSWFPQYLEFLVISVPVLAFRLIWILEFSFKLITDMYSSHCDRRYWNSGNGNIAIHRCDFEFELMCVTPCVFRNTRFWNLIEIWAHMHRCYWKLELRIVSVLETNTIYISGFELELEWVKPQVRFAI